MIGFKIKIADRVISINVFHESTKKYCEKFLTDKKPTYYITMREEDLLNEASNSVEGKVYADEEISALYRKIAELFINDDIVVFHGSSFKVDNFGFIVTAKSGVGKSTHVKLLEEHLGDKFKYINDDKPLLEIRNDNLILHSTPWNGKERRGTEVSSVPLKAIIFLNRGEENSYQKLENKEEVYFKLLNQVYLPREKDMREKALKIIDVIIKKANFYEINVNKDIKSAQMTYERIIKDEIK